MTHIIIYFTDITTVLQKVPDKHDLLNLLVDIDYEWEKIGISLGIPESVLDHLSQSNEDDTTNLCEVLTHWMDTMPSPVTWENIIRSLEGPIVQHPSTAHKIRNYLTKPEVYSEYQGM